jgi:hypothetical protein
LKAAVFTKEGLKLIDKDSPEYRETIGEKAYWEECRQEYFELEANRLRRIKSSYKGRVVNLILAVEKAYDVYLDEDTEQNYNHLWKLLKRSIDYWAGHYTYKWSGKWFCLEDFEEYFEDETRKEIDKHQYHKSPFYLSERVRKRLECRGHDFVRMKAKTRQGAFEHNLGRLCDFADEVYPGKDNTEKAVTEHILLEQMINDPSLTGLERKFLQVLRENLDASLGEISGIMGLGNKVKAWRLMNSIRKKLDKYREDALAYDADTYKWQCKQPKRKRGNIVVEVDGDLADDIEPEEAKKPDKRKKEISQKSLNAVAEKAGKNNTSPDKSPSPEKKAKKKRKRSEESLMRRRMRKKGQKEIIYPPDFDYTSLF